MSTPQIPPCPPSGSVITAIVPLASPAAAPRPVPAAPSPAGAALASGVFPRIDDDMPEEEEEEEEEDYFDEEDEEWDAEKELSKAMEEVDDQDWGDLHGGKQEQAACRKAATPTTR